MKSLLTLLTLVMVFVSSPMQAATNTNLTGKSSCCIKLEATKPLSDNSLFQLDSTWTNDHGRPVNLASFQGQPQIVTMFFTTCAFACPILVHDMKRIEAALPQNFRTNVGFVLISFDTDRDTPAILASYRVHQDLPANWTLLRGGSDDVLEIAALLGVKFKKDARGDFAHSNVISLLDKDGEIVTQQNGLNHDPHPISSAVKKLLKTEASQTRDINSRAEH